MSRGVKALVVALCVLLVVSLDVNFMLLRGRKTCKQTIPQEAVEEKIETETQEASIEKPLAPTVVEKTEKKEEAKESKKADSEFKLEDELIIRNTSIYTDGLYLYFDGKNDLRKATIEIEPAVKNLSARYYRNEIYVGGDFMPGTLYSVVVKDGERSAGVVVTAPDHYTRLEFQTCGTLFPLYNDYWNLPVKAENLEGKATVKVHQAYAARELEFLKNPSSSDFSKVISETTLLTKNIRNKAEEVCLDLEEAGIPRAPGLYRIELYDSKSNYYWNTRERTVIVTDLGVIATYADDEVAVAVRSLKDGAPVANARVQIFSQKLWEYYHGDTDENGFCRLPISDASEKEDSLAFLVVTKGKDRVYAYLERSGRVKSTSKAAVFTERGICRPGETMRVFASLRDMDLRAQGGVPMEFQLTDPRGNVIAKDVVTGDAEGLYEYDCAIPENGFTGYYSLMAYTPGKEKDREFEPYGSASFIVGEYVPDQIKLSFDAFLDEEGMAIDCSGKTEYYFGMPVSDASITLEARAERGRFAPKGFEDYHFGYNGNPWGGRVATTIVTTNDDGTFSGVLDVSECAKQIATPVRYELEAKSLPKAGGRPVVAHNVLQKDYAEYYVGARKEGDEETRECVIGVVGVAPNGNEISLADKGLKYSLKRYSWDYVLKNSASGMYERTWQRNEELVGEGELVLKDGKIIFGDEIAHGEFTLEIQNGEGVALCDLPFWHWGGESGARLKDPNSIVFELDKENYLPGETAIVTFDSPMEGSGIVMAGLHKLAEPMAFAAKMGRNEIAIPIPANLNTGSWFAAVAVACRKDTASDPILLKGIVSLNVRQDTHRLKVTVETPEECKPSTDMEVCVKLADSTGAPAVGEAILWGVDMGILSLTDYKTPDIFGFFFGPTNNPLTIGDNYKMLYPVINAGTGKIGGGDMAAKAKQFRGEIQERLAAPAIFHLGIVKTDESGVAKATVRLPEHTGALNVMAIAANSERTGSGSTEVILRRETSLLLTVPRVVAPGDEFQIAIQGFNHTLEKGTAQWKATMDGDGSMEVASGDFLLDKGGSAAKTIRVKAGAKEGRLTFKFTMTLGGVDAFAEANVVVRNAIPMTSTFDVVEIAPGETKEIAVGEYGELEIGTAALAVTGSLKWLSQYPYGCLEQVTATAMPMLSIQSLVDCGAVPASYALGARNNILKALADLSTKRQWEGWLSMWSGGSPAVWYEGSLFAYLFLLEADKAGYTLDASWRKQIVNNLKGYLNKTSNSLHDRVFANYLLAYVEPQTAVKYLKLLPENSQKIPEDADEKTREALLKRQCDGFCKFLIAMTRIKGGHAAEGVKDLEKLLQEDFLNGHAAFTGFDSTIRREGIVLWMLCDVLPEHPAVESIYKSLISHRNSEGHWGTTQENAWAALGLSRYCTLRKIGKISGIAVKGGKETSFTAPIRYEGANSIVVRNTGDSTITAFVRERKVPEKLEKVENGFFLYKLITDTEGNPIKEFKRGQLVCVSLNVRFDSDMVGDYVICDMLPGCLEIEDDNLVTRSHAKITPESVNTRLNLNYVEKRYDRFLGFGKNYAKTGMTMEITYNARVVTSGEFAIPPVMVESMYHPELKAITPYDCERMVAE